MIGEKFLLVINVLRQVWPLSLEVAHSRSMRKFRGSRRRSYQHTPRQPIQKGGMVRVCQQNCFASDDSSYINAVELMVDGGATGAPWGAPILRG